MMVDGIKAELSSHWPYLIDDKNKFQADFGFWKQIDRSGCEREVVESANGVSDKLKSESIMRLSWALVHSKQPKDVQCGIAMLEVQNMSKEEFLKIQLITVISKGSVGSKQSSSFEDTNSAKEKAKSIYPPIESHWNLPPQKEYKKLSSLNLNCKSMLSYPLKIRDSLKRIRKSQSLLAVPKEARDPKDDQIVQSFRELLLLEGHLPGKHSDYHTFTIFLQMRDFDLMKAKDMFLQYLKWREEFEVDTTVKEFKFEEYKEVKKCYPHGFHGVDKYGRPLYIERVGMVDLNAFLQITTIDRFMKYHVSEQEKTLNWRYPACSVSAKKRIASTTSILDVKGVVAKENGTTLPPTALFIIRYHSFYPLHKSGAYTHLMNADDVENLKWLKIFNKYDLYSKSKVRIDVEKVKPYYLSLIEKG
ncbi:unnamed protein product [Camellia sinensis]